MIHTGKFLLSRDFQKLIIITGALLPERFKHSNASFNIGCAIGAIQDLDGGVYICMNGIIKTVSESRRDLETGKFY
jgi:L-asparaginase